jgi:hypothetical protein
MSLMVAVQRESWDLVALFLPLLVLAELALK